MLAPKGDKNGLTDLADLFARMVAGGEPRKITPCLALVVPRRMMTDAESGQQTVTVQIVRIEALLDMDLGKAEEFIRRSLEARFGQTTLPLDLQDDLEKAFKGLDFDVPVPEVPDPETERPDDPTGEGKIIRDDEPGDEHPRGLGEPGTDDGPPLDDDSQDRRAE
jgi:hypothetical protein